MQFCGTSLAVVKAAANSLGIPLYKYLANKEEISLPVPMMNILNGGKHASNNINFQEFMIVPNADKMTDRIKMCVEVYNALKNTLKEKKMSISVGDEGGFAPNITEELALDFIMLAIDKAGYRAGHDFNIALDVAANEMYEEAKKVDKEGYLFWKTGEFKSTQDMVKYYDNLVEKYPIISIEDGLAEEDWEGWEILTKSLGSKIQLVGDDLFVTNIERLIKGIKQNAANAILIKPNQIGTLTETLQAISLAKQNGYKTIISHRSGETEDTTIADLAVGINAGQIKTGAPCRGERTAKYNRLLKIEEKLTEE